MAGERIKSLGTLGIGDIYELPFAGLDYLFRFKIDKHNFSFKAKNLLLQERRDFIKDGNRSLSYNSYTEAQLKDIYSRYPADFTFTRIEGLSYEAGYQYEF